MQEQERARQLVVHGLAMILAGLLWGLVVPHAPFPRLALTAHIEFGVNGLLFGALGLVMITVQHSINPRSAAFVVVAAWLTWAMLGSEMLNAWWGADDILPLAAAEAGATGATPLQEGIVTVAHVAGGLAQIVAVALVLRGVLKRPAPWR